MCPKKSLHRKKPPKIDTECIRFYPNVCSNLNRVSLVETVKSDPVLQENQKKEPFMSFCLGNNEKGEQNLFQIEIFDPTFIVFVPNHLKRGSKILVEGALYSSRLDDKSNGPIYQAIVRVSKGSGKVFLLQNSDFTKTPSHKS